MPAIERHGLGVISAGILASAVGKFVLALGRYVGAVVSAGELVIIGFLHARCCYPELAPNRKLGFGLRLEDLVEQPVMTEFVGSYAARDLFEHRFIGCVSNRAVERRGARFHDAARNHLTALGATHRILGSIEVRRPVKRAETREGTRKIKRGIGEYRPATEGQAMLDLFFTPMLDLPNRVSRRVAIYALQIGDIVWSIVFDERGSLDRGEQLTVDLRRLEAGPIDIVESPACAINCAIGHPILLCRCLSSCSQEPYLKRRGRSKSKRIAALRLEAIETAQISEGSAMKGAKLPLAIASNGPGSRSPAHARHHPWQGQGPLRHP